MLIAEGRFKRKSGASGENVKDHVLNYLGALAVNGQVYGDWQYGWADDELVVILHIPTIDAVATKHNSHRVTKAYELLLSFLSSKPSWKIITNVPDQKYAKAGAASFYYMYTNALTVEPPLRSGDNGNPIPTYLLYLKYRTREELSWWLNSSALHDAMWIQSGKLERAAYRQLADPKSELSESGRAVCREIETQTKIPTYYYLMRYHKLPGKQPREVCPDCGRKWLVLEYDEKLRFWHFHLKCDNCRLVAHLPME